MKAGTPSQLDVVVIGGGIVGLATARALLRTYPGMALDVLEKEEQLAAHQTGHNSGVIHSGLYYRPGSAKAGLCVAGRDALYQFCEEHAIAYQKCGKVVVATREEQLPALEELERRGSANGLQGLERLDAETLLTYEPHLSGVAGLLVPETGVVDFREVARVLGQEISRNGGRVRTGCQVRGILPLRDGLLLETSFGSLRAKTLINCAGLHSDRMARMCGIDPEVRIVPFRGEYYHLRPRGAALVNHLIYPVPDPALPFLGVHLTRSVNGEVEAGPNAVLALKREGYRRSDISLRDCWDILTFPGFWKMARGYWRVGLGEYLRSFSRQRFLRDLQQLVPNLREEDLGEWGSGVRAQAMDLEGKLLDDFCIRSDERMVHVLNAPSPAATASLAIGDHIARLAGDQFGLS